MVTSCKQEQASAETSLQLGRQGITRTAHLAKVRESSHHQHVWHFSVIAEAAQRQRGSKVSSQCLA